MEKSAFDNFYHYLFQEQIKKDLAISSVVKKDPKLKSDVSKALDTQSKALMLSAKDIQDAKNELSSTGSTSNFGIGI